MGLIKHETIQNTPKSRSVIRIRWLLAFLSSLVTLLVIYASLVPLHYHAIPIDQAIGEFRDVRWLQLGIERRADWVANGLILLPSGFLAAGAVDWRRNSRLALLLLSPLIIMLLMCVVVAIEFTQIWFPPRVVSQNDMFAGVIGSIAGVVLWWACGERIIETLVRLYCTQPGLVRVSQVAEIGLAGLLVYNLMPLDLILSGSEWQQKLAGNRVTFIPFADWSGGKKQILFLGLAAFKLAPYVFLTAIRKPAIDAMRIAAFWVIVLELVKLPVYSRSFSVTSIIAGLVGSVMVIKMAHSIWERMRSMDRAISWFTLAGLWSIAMLFGFLSRFERMVSDPKELHQRLYGILAVPFARAHSSSEFEAGENILVKIAVFSLLSFLLSGWCSRIHDTRIRRSAMAASMMWMVMIAMFVEVAQAFLVPLVPDLTDFIIYGLGMTVGWIVRGRLLVASGERQVTRGAAIEK